MKYFLLFIFILAFLCVLILGICSQTGIVNDSDANYQAGYVAFNAGDYSTAKKEFEISAKKGHSGAQAMLGSMYYDGKGVRKDYSAALKWFQLAASKEGVPVIQGILAKMYYCGEGVRKDYHEAFKWCKAAVEQNDPYGQRLLGIMYYYGQVVQQDYYEAVKYYDLAAHQDDAIAQRLLALMYYEGTGIRQNKLKAKEWFGRSCDNGEQEGCDNYRKLNEQGY